MLISLTYLFNFLLSPLPMRFFCVRSFLILSPVFLVDLCPPVPSPDSFYRSRAFQILSIFPTCLPPQQFSAFKRRNSPVLSCLLITGGFGFFNYRLSHRFSAKSWNSLHPRHPDNYSLKRLEREREEKRLIRFTGAINIVVLWVSA